MRYNNLSLFVYEAFGTTPLIDATWELNGAKVDYFETMYPGGIFGGAQIDIPLKYDTWNLLKPYPYRWLIKNGTQVVYEGWAQAHEGRVTIPLAGAWGAWARRDGIRRWYADNRIDDKTWPLAKLQTGSEKTVVDRTERIRLTPRNEAWNNGQVGGVVLSTPTGEKVKRITFDYDLTTQNDEDWTLSVYDIENLSSLWSVARTTTGSSTGSEDITLTTTSNNIRIMLTSNAAQTPAVGGASNIYSYGEISDLMVYAETNNSGSYVDTPQKLMLDTISEFSDWINASTMFVGTNTLNMAPFITSGGNTEDVGSILGRAAGYGDSSNNAWAVGFYESTKILWDGKPVLYYEQQPALTDYDYQIFVDTERPGGGVQVDRDMAAIYNWIVVQFTDLNGRSQEITPDDYATLKSTSSIDRWEKRMQVISVGQASEADALNFGIRYLTEYQYSRFNLNPINVRGYILDKYGQPIPTSQVRAGKRVRVMDMPGYAPDASLQERLTFIIRRTRYTDDNETVSITAERDNNLDIVLGRLRRKNTRV